MVAQLRAEVLARGQAPKSYEWTNTYFSFTIVREPLAAALSAYLEVSMRRQDAGHMDGAPTTANASFRALPCSTPAQANARFLAFLDTARRGKPLGTEFFHVRACAGSKLLRHTHRSSWGAAPSLVPTAARGAPLPLSCTSVARSD
jgi:hypothetical protein